MSTNNGNSGSETPKGLEQSTGVFGESTAENFKKMGKNIAEAFKNPLEILNDMSKLQEISYKLTVKTMGQSKIMGDALMTTLSRASFEGADYGLTLDDNLQTLQAMNEVMGMNTTLTSDQVINMGLLARNAGVTASEIAPIVEGFRSMGIDTTRAIDHISEMQSQARTYGINVSQFMKNIGTNIKALSTYNFKDGVEGFSRMVAKAQALRIDVQKTFSLSQSLLEPEKAIEMAAGFQMLGGAVGDLGDPFKLLHMAQTDTEGLQDSILKAAESAVVFNNKTGKFDIPVTEMYRLKEMAEMTGISYEELSQTAIKAAERTQKLDMLGGAAYDDETKELIANLGQIDEFGNLQISMPGQDEMDNKITKMVDAASLTMDDIATLQKMQEDANKSDRDIAAEQLSAVEEIKAAVTKSSYARIQMGTSTPIAGDALDIHKASAEAQIQLMNEAFGSDNMEQIGMTLSNAILSGFKKNEMDAFSSTGGMVISQLTEGLSNMFESIGEHTDENNKIMNALKNAPEEVNTVLNGISIGISTFVDTLSTVLTDQILSQEQDFSQDLTPDNDTNNVQVLNQPTPLNPRGGDYTPFSFHNAGGSIREEIEINHSITFGSDGSIPPNMYDTILNALQNDPDFMVRLKESILETGNGY